MGFCCTTLEAFIVFDYISVYPSSGARTILTANDHVSTGSTSSIYVKGDVAFKLYADPKRAAQDGILRKMPVLSIIEHPNILAPTGTVTNRDGEFLGITMPRAAGTPLAKMFSTGHRDATRLGLADIAILVDRMREVTNVAHSHRALMVNANETSWLLQGHNPLAIDVDSWQLPGFPTSAVLPSIRDYTDELFSPGTDWFSWAVVTFMLWTGLHPYKGRHPDFDSADLATRMRAQASVLNPRVRLPNTVRAFSNIPPPLLSWYEQIFNSSERSGPPPVSKTYVVPATPPKSKLLDSLAGTLRLERLGSPGDEILLAVNGFLLSRIGETLVLWDALAKNSVSGVSEEDLARVLAGEAAIVRAGGCRIVIRARGEKYFEAQRIGGGPASAISTPARKMWQTGNRVFALIPGASNGLVEVEAVELGGRLILAPKQTYPVPALGIKTFPGGFIQDCLGVPFLALVGASGMLLAPAPCLRGYRFINGFGVDKDNMWVTAIRLSDGETVRLSIGHKVNSWVVDFELVVSSSEIDAALTTSGVGALRDGITLRIAKGTTRRILNCTGLSGSLRLFSLGGGIGARDDGEAMKLSLS